jgi:hypothetical protein
MFGNVLKKFKNTEEDENLIPMRIEIGDRVTTMDDITSGTLKKTIKALTKKQRLKLAPYKDLVDSHGRRIEIVFKFPNLLAAAKMEVAVQIPEELQPLVKGFEKAERIA